SYFVCADRLLSMATLEANVGFLLARVNAKYPKAARKDILSALSKFNDLHPSVKNFAPAEGKCEKLTFRLKGTINIKYKGNGYNIPLTIFLLNTHPYYAPECFVCPTKNMVLKESAIIDRNGRIRLPYLTNWRYPEYDLSGLLQVITRRFQERCPVYSKTASKPSAPQLPSLESIHGAIEENIEIKAEKPQSSIVEEPEAGCSSQFDRPSRRKDETNLPKLTKEDCLRKSLLSAIKEKIMRQLHENIGVTFAEIISLRQAYNELKEGIKIIKSMLQQLDAEHKQLLEIIAVYMAKKSEIKALIDSREIKNLDIDTVIDAPTPLHRQLLRSHVFDISISDTIFVLDEAVRCGRITTSIYFKQIRSLSSKQFLARVTVLKCRRKANLPV
uniref:UEV domain-containing protein n=2 Tax=Parascaris univalens TaxID=6257 RepID=A0A914ZQD6_PARUN